MLQAEQGLGDTLQFVRYASLVAARGGRVTLEVQPELHRLLSDFPGVEEVVPRGAPLPNCSWQCPLLSLPLAFGADLAMIPSRVPYLHVNTATTTWAGRLAGPGLRVGLVWAGRPAHRDDHRRSLSLAMLKSLAATGIAFFSLQKGPCAEQTLSPPDGMALTDLAPYLDDFSDTAAAITALDLVITVDTSVAHLAGALGKPTWILLPRVADWRWLLDREDSPWYPTARLFRQPAADAWVPVIARVAGELRRLVAGDQSVLLPRTA